MKNNIKIELSNIEDFKNLVLLLEKHFQDLPQELKDSIEDIEENGLSDLDSSDFSIATMHLEKNSKVTSSLSDDIYVIRINKVLKRVYYLEKDKNGNIIFDEKHKELDSFWIKKGDSVIWEW